MRNKISRLSGGFITLVMLSLLMSQFQSHDEIARAIDVGPVLSTKVISESPQNIAKTTTPPENTKVEAEVLPTIIVESEPPTTTTRKRIEVNLFHNQEQGQQFYAFEDDLLVMSGPVSGAISDQDSPPDNHPDNPHNHLGTFFVTKRLDHHTSSIYQTPMDFCLFYHGGHAIHACLPEEIAQLGFPASHGCVRVSPSDAEMLFNWAGNDPVKITVLKRKHS